MNKIIEVLGIPPKSLLDQGSKTKRYFDLLPDGTYCLNKKHRDHRKEYKAPGARKLHDVLGVEIGGPGGRRRDMPGHSIVDYMNFQVFTAYSFICFERKSWRLVRTLNFNFEFSSILRTTPRARFPPHLCS